MDSIHTAETQLKQFKTSLMKTYFGAQQSSFQPYEYHQLKLLKWPPKSMSAAGAVITSFACVGFGALEEVPSKEWFLGLCVAIRFTAGMGSAMLTVASTSILLKTSSYSPSTIVSLTEMIMGLGYSLWPALGAALFESASSALIVAQIMYIRTGWAVKLQSSGDS